MVMYNVIPYSCFCASIYLNIEIYSLGSPWVMLHYNKGTVAQLQILEIKTRKSIPSPQRKKVVSDILAKIAFLH